jgi:hypothetical protein
MPSTSLTVMRITDRWERFASSLSVQDVEVLDRAAAGYKLKVVCHEMQVSYDTVQKRFKRWQQELNLRSLPMLLHVWRTVRARQTVIDDSDPTLLRYAAEVAEEAAMRLAVPLPDVVVPEAQRKRQPPAEVFAKRARTRRSDMVQLTQCVLCPALWHTLLSIGQELGEHALQRAHVLAQHRLFLHLLTPQIAIPPDESAITELLAWLHDVDRATSMMSSGRGTPVALPLLVAARRTHVLDGYAMSGAELALRNATRSQANAIWERVAAAMSTTACTSLDDIALLHAVWRAELSPDEWMSQAAGATRILGPMTGLAVALFTAMPVTGDASRASAHLLRSIVRARLRHAEILGVHPARLLAHFSMQASGVASSPESFLLHPGELLLSDGDDDLARLLDAEQGAVALHKARSPQSQPLVQSWPAWSTSTAILL